MTFRWPAESLWEQVAPLLPGFTVEILPQIDSTNTELMRRARAGQTEPILLVAERQTAGRGRLGRDWHSDTQDGLATLTFSLGLPLQPADWSGLSLAVGLALVQALHPALQLKWPNDVWLDGRKLAGILIETTSVGDLRYAVIGIGINLLARDSAGLRTPAAALQELLPRADAPSTLEAVLLPLVRAVQAFETQGFAVLRQAFHTRDLLYGREVLCTDGTQGLARGVDTGGALLVHTASGLQKISSAEVSVRPVPSPATPTDL
jgi:BirA family transcriptional regulator, biotin operon repressor / biotin---[acetyl-CoA-carboxylase] ligase